MSDTVLKNGQVQHKVIPFATTLGPVRPSQRKPKETPEVEAAREEARAAGMKEGLVVGTQKGELGGYLAGIKRGRIEGEKAAYAEVMAIEGKVIEELRAELAQIADLNQAAMENWAKSAEAALLNRVVDITRHILGQELSMSRESLIPMIASAVREVANARTARIRVNPFDRHLVAEHKAEIIAMSANLQHLEIVDDPTILGGAIVETEGGKVDATLESKLISLQDELSRANETEAPKLEVIADEEVA